jgi:hypothetical protein
MLLSVEQERVGHRELHLRESPLRAQHPARAKCGAGDSEQDDAPEEEARGGVLAQRAVRQHACARGRESVGTRLRHGGSLRHNPRQARQRAEERAEKERKVLRALHCVRGSKVCQELLQGCKRPAAVPRDRVLEARNVPRRRERRPHAPQGLGRVRPTAATAAKQARERLKLLLLLLTRGASGCRRG